MSDDTASDWKMPEPVFRSTDGRKPGTDPQADIPTEPGFARKEKEEAATAAQTVRPISQRRIRHKKKATSTNPLRTTIIVLVISVVAIVGFVVYFVFFSRSR